MGLSTIIVRQPLNIVMCLQLYPKLLQSFVEHWLGDDALYGVGEDVYHALLDKVFAYYEGYLAAGRRVVELSDMRFALGADKWKLQLWNYGVAAIVIHYAYKCLDAARHIYRGVGHIAYAEWELSCIGAVALAQHPYILCCELSRCEALFII